MVSDHVPLRITRLRISVKKVLFGKVGDVMVQESPSGGGGSSLKGNGDITAASVVESIVGCKWSVHLLMLIADGCSRPSALLRACPGLSTKVMNERLKKMLRFGLVQRSVSGDKPPLQVDYMLTPFGRRFMGGLKEIGRLQEALDREKQ